MPQPTPVLDVGDGKARGEDDKGAAHHHQIVELVAFHGPLHWERSERGRLSGAPR